VTDPIESRVANTREDLQATLDAIENKLNVPRRVGDLRDKAMKSYESNPVPWIIGAVAAAVAIAGVVAWAILSDDD
jgi:hypothetical protein